MTTATHAAGAALDVARIRRDFPALGQRVHGRRLVFLDSAASSQKPEQVLRAMDRTYRANYANVHRGAYSFSRRSTDQYDQARATVAEFIGAPSPSQIVFTRNATEALKAPRVNEVLDIRPVQTLAEAVELALEPASSTATGTSPVT